MPLSTPPQKHYTIALLPGDGLGPQLSTYASRILTQISATRPHLSFSITSHPFGGAALSSGHASPLPEETLRAARESSAALLCGCGDPKYGREPEKGLLRLREELGVYANIRPVAFPSTRLAEECSSFRADKVQGLDVTFVRDLTGGVYYGARQEADDDPNGAGEAYDTTAYTRSQISRLARWAGHYASSFTPPKPVHSVDKWNVMATSRLWRKTVSEVFEDEFPRVPLRHVLVDEAAMVLSSNPTELNGIVLTENLFGDILSDQVGGIVGSQQVLASAAVSTFPGETECGKPGIFEPFDLKSEKVLRNPLGIVQAVGLMLALGLGLAAEADALSKAVRQTLDPVELIGSDVRTVDLGGSATADEFMAKLLENLDLYLEAANSADLAAAALPSPTATSISSRPLDRRPMGIIEKIMTHAGVGLTRPDVRPGEMICVKVDWTITSELLWAGMEKTYDQMGRPRPYRNDRLWLAVDHTVDPRTNHQPRQRGLIAKAERFRREAKIVDFLPANTSIMHTDFTRDRAQPGRIVVGSDSHTCSAGSMGAFAIGFGAADVVMPMVTGETWFRVPEVCRINFVGKLPFGVGGKDVILHILGLFKRNTIAFQRAVEYGGPGLKELSMDARFAIANMNTEFGGMGACFEADENTADWIARRPHPQHRRGGLYFRADPGAQYVEERTIDLSEVGVTMALYPNPDDVVPVAAKAGMKLDGCFIGACTTTEEDLIVGALVLEAGLRAGLVPVAHGKRRVTPGSLTIIKNLERHGLTSIYRQAGFDIGAPGCSYCVGINDVDVAGEGEVWLSSQNRNFRNRMGKGSFGNITCAAAVAASSFSMEVTDPRWLLERLDRKRFDRLVNTWKATVKITPEIHEPEPEAASAAPAMESMLDGIPVAKSARVVTSRVQRFAENVDTYVVPFHSQSETNMCSDAIIPAEFMPGVDNADLGSHCFQYFRPEFREKAINGSQIMYVLIPLSLDRS
jgi:3-isopropylmalate dehydrogenase